MTNAIQPHEYYTSPTPSIDDSQKIIYVIDDPHIKPADFYKNFRTYYGNQYDAKYIILIHNSGCHWTTYHANLSSTTSPTTHDTSPNGRCSIHATAKALEIATGTTLGTSLNGQFHINHESDSSQIISRLQLQSADTELKTKIQNLATHPRSENWLAGDDIANILINSGLTQNPSNSIFVAAGHDNSKFNSKESIHKNWDNEIMELLCGDAQWNGDKFSGTYNFTDNPDKQKYFESTIPSNADKNEVIKTLFQKYSEFQFTTTNNVDYELQGGKDKLDEFNSLKIENPKSFLEFVQKNSNKFNDQSKQFIKDTLRHIKFGYMVNTGNTFKMPIGENDRVEIINNLDEIITQLDGKVLPLQPFNQTIASSTQLPLLASLSSSPTDWIDVQSSPASIIQPTITKAIEKLEQTKSRDQKPILSWDDFEDSAKINETNKSEIDPELLKKRKYVLVDDSGNSSVMRVASDDHGNLKFNKIRFDGYSDLALFSEYINFAENSNENTSQISNLNTFKLQPPKFKGFGLKLNFSNNELFLEDYFNNDFGTSLDSKKNKKIAEINDIKIKDHIGIAQTLGIDEKIYFTSLLRSSEKNIKLKFDGDTDNIELDSTKKAVFKQSGQGLSYIKIDAPDFDKKIESCKKEIDKTSLTAPSATILSPTATTTSTNTTSLTGQA